MTSPNDDIVLPRVEAQSTKSKLPPGIKMMWMGKNRVVFVKFRLGCPPMPLPPHEQTRLAIEFGLTDD